MKKISTILSLLVAILCYCQNSNNTTLKSENLKGSVYYITETSYSAQEKFGVIEKYGTPTKYSYTYNEYGNIMEKKLFNNDGRVTVKWNYVYDNVRKLTEENVTVNISDPSLYLLYGDGKKTIFKYDKNGYRVESNEFDLKENLLSKTKFRNDSNGNLLESNLYFANGNLQFKYVFKYSKSGKKSEVIKYDSNGDLIETKKLKYDEKARYSGEDYFNSSNDLTSKNRFKYDNKGSISENGFYKGDGSLDFKLTYKQQYDRIGNWTISSEFENGVAKKIVERNIEYYKKELAPTK